MGRAYFGLRLTLIPHGRTTNCTFNIEGEGCISWNSQVPSTKMPMRCPKSEFLIGIIYEYDSILHVNQGLSSSTGSSESGAHTFVWSKIKMCKVHFPSSVVPQACSVVPMCGAVVGMRRPYQGNIPSLGATYNI